MSEYQPGAIECEPAPENPNPRPNPDDACRPPSSRPRDREDPDDSERERETKRPFLDLNNDPIPEFDLNEIPEDQGEAGGANQGYNCRQVDLSNFPGEIGRDPFARAFPGSDISDTSVLWDIRGDNFGMPLVLTREENVSTKPRVQQKMMCYEVLTSGTTVDIHDELRR
jgi:hypothetical protein